MVPGNTRLAKQQVRLACNPADHPNSWAIGMMATLRQILSILQRSKASAVGAITVSSVAPVSSNAPVLSHIQPTVAAP